MTENDSTARLRREAAERLAELEEAYTTVAAEVRVNQQSREDARTTFNELDRGDERRLADAASAVMDARERLVGMKAAHISLERAEEATPPLTLTKEQASRLGVSTTGAA